MGEVRHVPYWTAQEEKALLGMIKENVSIEEIAEHFHRSEDAIAMKTKRMDLTISSALQVSSSSHPSSQKVSSSE